MAPDEQIIRIVAALALNPQGRTLLVRKRGTEAFMLPGGKLAAEESPFEALEREVCEELACGLDRAACRSLGIFRAPAAHEPSFIVEAELFAVSLEGEPRASGEIEELVWIDPEAPLPYPLAQLAREHALPLARQLKASVGSGR
jgi:8-oxo-dGTP diphosphatase